MRGELLNILIVDDSDHDLGLIKRKIQSRFKKTEFVTAHSMDEFKERIEWVSPDVIISDYDLRGCTGLDILLYLKEVNPDIPFLFVSGTLNSDSKTAKAILSGASGFVLKDNLEDLPDVLAEVLDQNDVMNASKQSRLDLIASSQLKLQQLSEALKSDSSIDTASRYLSLIKEIREQLENAK